MVFDALKTDFRKLKISINRKCVNKCWGLSSLSSVFYF
jgi:hypothetical protein